MNKEEIEEIKSLLFQDRLTQYGKRKLIKYVDYLESKLNKVTDKLKEDIKIYGNYEERKQMCKEQLYENDGKWFHSQEILNIIEGERNNG